MFDEHTGAVVGTLSEERWRRGLEGKRQQQAMHDVQPPRMRALVAEHNVDKGREMYRAEHQATHERCPHGRWAPKCAQCVWDNRPAATGRDGAALTRTSGPTAAEILERARKRGLDV